MWDLQSKKQIRTIALYDSLESLVILPESFNLYGFEHGLSGIKAPTGGICVAAGGENGSFIIYL